MEAGLAALEAAEALGRLAPEDVDSLVFAARAYALCFKAQGAVETDGAAHETTMKAVGASRKALKLRPRLFQTGSIDPDLNPLFGLAEFRGLLKPPVMHASP